MTRIKMEWLADSDALDFQSAIDRFTIDLISGKGGTDCTCFACGETTLKRVRPKQVKKLVVRCPTCNTNCKVVDGRESRL